MQQDACELSRVVAGDHRQAGRGLDEAGIGLLDAEPFRQNIEDFTAQIGPSLNYTKCR
jgi:hypothetical protein